MKLRAASGASEGHWLRAEKQSGGKGRLGRTWESPIGNLYCSTIVARRDDDPPPSSLSFVAALAVYDAIQTSLPTGAKISLKWPNDLLLFGAKTCGILLEATNAAVIVGIGVNIAVVPDVEGRVVTSLHNEGANTMLTPGMFLELLAEKFAKRLKSWRKDGLRACLDEWEKRAHPIGTSLTVTTERGKPENGEYAGISPQGALRLRKPDGTLIEIHAGDVEA